MKKTITKAQCIFINLTNDFHSQGLLTGGSFIEHIRMTSSCRPGTEMCVRRGSRDHGGPSPRGRYVLWATAAGGTAQRRPGPPAWRSCAGRGEGPPVCEPGHFLTLWILAHFPTTTLLDKYEGRGKEVHLSKAQFLQKKFHSLL